MTTEHKTNHCGPAGDDFTSRSISWVLSDTFLGVYLGDCCKEHDNSWESGANKHGDEEFKKCVRCEFKSKYKNHRIGLFVSGIFFVGVRIGNGVYKLLGK